MLRCYCNPLSGIKRTEFCRRISISYDIPRITNDEKDTLAHKGKSVLFYYLKISKKIIENICVVLIRN